MVCPHGSLLKAALPQGSFLLVTAGVAGLFGVADVVLRVDDNHGSVVFELLAHGFENDDKLG